MSRLGRILVAMSGGVDSCVAAVMLHEEGYEVIGVTMKTWDYTRSGNGNTKETGCCTLESINDARHVAISLGLRHYVIDLREEFGTYIIDKFVQDYTSGRTPNPCVLCNTYIKWEALLRRADIFDCQWIATGHYAKLHRKNNRYIISKGYDQNKDQSYALWGVAQKHLARTNLPLGGYKKTKIRQLAKKFQLGDIAKKKDSYEICFIPDNNYRRFLDQEVEDLKEGKYSGNFVNTKGDIIGSHRGYPYFTVGQRRGLGLTGSKSQYVLNIDPETSTIMVGEREETCFYDCTVKGITYGKYADFSNNWAKDNTLSAKIRYNDSGDLVCISRVDHNVIHAHFPNGRYSITPGQALVVYQNNDIVLGGWIDKVTVGKSSIKMY